MSDAEGGGGGVIISISICVEGGRGSSRYIKLVVIRLEGIRGAAVSAACIADYWKRVKAHSHGRSNNSKRFLPITHVRTSYTSGCLRSQPRSSVACCRCGEGSRNCCSNRKSRTSGRSSSTGGVESYSDPVPCYYCTSSRAVRTIIYAVSPCPSSGASRYRYGSSSVYACYCNNIRIYVSG